MKQLLVKWFESIGYAACLSRQFGQTFTPPYFYSLAKYLAFDRVKETLGLDKCAKGRAAKIGRGW